jgi:Glyoxalase-like domain
VELDHILLAVRDLDVAAEYLDGEHGLRSYVGGIHPRWGTANRIVPLGSSYLELIAVVDAGVAAGTDVGRWVADGAADAGAPIGWAVRPQDFDATTERLGLTAHEGARARPDGTIVRWRMAGIDRAFSEPQLPWFIEWNEQATYPGMAETPLDANVVRVEIEGDAATLDEWLGAHAMPVEQRPGGRGITSVTLATESGEIVLSR